MCVTLSAARPGPAAEEAFAAALPRVQAVARFATRRVPCPDAREELAAEAVALDWRCYVALHRRGKDPGAFVTTIARRSAQAALGGSRVCGSRSSATPSRRSPGSAAGCELSGSGTACRVGASVRERS
ncbi:sigma factor [Urbifossiella limnaea]|uniref:Uncharacterized protein n=1 Tax=Urbifossiella limnaea TaxID=2528023 RepID=A0A517XV09_9BACT|nr:sigma factor [Urbifossiella limnaea]QDU21327.1 hypothetical protein ETAA1_32930 [Urbifossiella limnaea]